MIEQSGFSSALEIKYAQCEFKRVSGEGLFEGYASVFGTPDLSKDVVEQGAFRDSIKKRGARGIKMLFQHDANEPIGIWTQVKEDARGLFVKGQLMPDITKAREVLSLMKAGVLDGLSIGFKTVEGRRDPATGIRHLRKIDLWEISVVTFPLLPQARVQQVKYGLPTEREFERWLTQDAGFSRSHARTVIRSGFKTLKRTPGAAQGIDTQLLVKLRRAAAMLRSETSV